MKLYVGNLPYSATEEQLKEKFSAFGEVTSVNIITDRLSGRSKGFGFVEMADDNQAKEAMNALANWELEGRTIKVNEARPKEKRSFGGGGGGGFQKRQRRF